MEKGRTGNQEDQQNRTGGEQLPQLPGRLQLRAAVIRAQPLRQERQGAQLHTHTNAAGEESRYRTEL